MRWSSTRASLRKLGLRTVTLSLKFRTLEISTRASKTLRLICWRGRRQWQSSLMKNSVKSAVTGQWWTLRSWSWTTGSPNWPWVTIWLRWKRPPYKKVRKRKTKRSGIRLVSSLKSLLQSICLRTCAAIRTSRTTRRPCRTASNLYGRRATMNSLTVRKPPSSSLSISTSTWGISSKSLLASIWTRLSKAIPLMMRNLRRRMIELSVTIEMIQVK